MAGDLNTEVLDDPASCRNTAHWLGRLGPGVSGIGDTLNSQRSASESFWQGTAGDACRQELGDQAGEVDELETQITKVRQALEIFATEIDGVKSKMAQARGIARSARLIVTPTEILPPEPAPQGPPSSEAQKSVQDEAQRKRQAFYKAKDVVDAGRTQQDDAHTALEEAMEDPLAAMKLLKAWVAVSSATVVGTFASSYTESKKFLDQAEQWRTAAKEAPISGGPHPVKSTMIEDTRNKANAPGKFGNNFLPDKAGKALNVGPADLITGEGAVAGAGKTVLRGVPVVGTGMTIASGVVDVVAFDKDPVDAAIDQGAILGGGAAVGMVAGGTLGSVVPGVGTIIGGAVGGVVGSLAAPKAVEDMRN